MQASFVPDSAAPADLHSSVMPIPWALSEDAMPGFKARLEIQYTHYGAIIIYSPDANDRHEPAYRVSSGTMRGITL
jgi:hypothetical protein